MHIPWLSDVILYGHMGHMGHRTRWLEGFTCSTISWYQKQYQIYTNQFSWDLGNQLLWLAVESWTVGRWNQRKPGQRQRHLLEDKYWNRFWRENMLKLIYKQTNCDKWNQMVRLQSQTVGILHNPSWLAEVKSQT